MRADSVVVASICLASALVDRAALCVAGASEGKLSRAQLARLNYLNTFCKRQWPEFGAHDDPLLIKPSRGSAVIWANVRTASPKKVFVTLPLI